MLTSGEEDFRQDNTQEQRPRVRKNVFEELNSRGGCSKEKRINYVRSEK